MFADPSALNLDLNVSLPVCSLSWELDKVVSAEDEVMLASVSCFYGEGPP